MTHDTPAGAAAQAAALEMDAESFRRYGRQIIDWIADYLEHPERYPVLSRVRPGEVKAALPQLHPDAPTSMEAILEQFERVILPGITHWNHPGFFAYFAITGSAPGILGELLTAALNVNGMLWKTSPAATELEERALDWLRQMTGLPESFRGVIMDTASVASLVAIAAAREALDLEVRNEGLAGRPDLPRLRLYTSEQAHSSIEKAAITLGLGQRGVCTIAVDAQYRLDPEALERAIEADRRAGWLPFCVAATVGTTSTTSIDPVPAIAAICRRHGLWLHVDGAYGGMAAIAPEFRHVLAGCEEADSLVINPHKWLFTPIDCSALYVRSPELLRRTFSLVPAYLETAEEDVTNYNEWGVQLGRRFRALKLWMVLSYFGHERLAAAIAEHCRLAQRFAAWVAAAPDFRLMAPVPLSTVCFRAQPPDLGDDEEALTRLNEALLEEVNGGGEVFLSHTRLQGRFVLRLAIGHLRTTEQHIGRAWQVLQAALLARLRPPTP